MSSLIWIYSLHSICFGLMRWKGSLIRVTSPSTQMINMLRAVSVDGKLMIFFLIFLENRIWHFMQIVSLGFSWSVRSYFLGNRIWHFMKFVSLRKKDLTRHAAICMKYQILFSRKNTIFSKCRLLKFLSRMQNVKQRYVSCSVGPVGYKLFPMVISRRQKSPLAGK